MGLVLVMCIVAAHQDLRWITVVLYLLLPKMSGQMLAQSAFSSDFSQGRLRSNSKIIPIYLISTTVIRTSHPHIAKCFIDFVINICMPFCAAISSEQVI